MDLNSKYFTYSAALLVIFIWSITFVSTKILLRYLSPTEILVYRYVIAYLVFVALDPRFIKPRCLREERSFALAGLLGVTLYFLCENFALAYSTASNVALLVSAAPMLTGVAAHLMTKNEKMTKNFVWGCIFGLTGVFMLVFNGRFVLKLNPLGDLLAILAALSFALYSIVIRDINKSYPLAVITRKSFFYSLVFLAPMLFTPAFRFKPDVLMRSDVMANLIFLGVMASSVCFLLWNKVIWALGAVRANNLMYLSPPLAIIAAAVVLREQITLFYIIGGVFVLLGVYIAQRQ